MDIVFFFPCLKGVIHVNFGLASFYLRRICVDRSKVHECILVGVFMGTTKSDVLI